MPRRRAFSLLAATLIAALTVPVAAQSMLVDVMNTRAELSGRVWGTGHWILFCVEEDEKDLNGDGDGQDTIVCVGDLRTMTVQSTSLAVNYSLTDNDADQPAAAGTDLIAIQVSEAEAGGQDLNNNGMSTDDVLATYNPATKQKTMLGVTGRYPTWADGKLYFQQPEVTAKKDLNTDGDIRDLVLTVYDPKTNVTESLGAECSAGFRISGDWIATVTSEAGQGNRDLNGDKDMLDPVVQLYQISAKRWLNTGLETALEKEVSIQLTSKLLAVATNEAGQGARDLNGDKDARDCVLHVVTLPADATGQLSVFNTGQDCSSGISADGTIVGLVTSEKDQADVDLNDDKDKLDSVVQCFTLGAQQVVNLKTEGTEGIYVAGGKIAIPCSEQDQGAKDLNGDKDTDDYVLFLYNAAQNKITNMRTTVEQSLIGNEGMLIWKVLEADQANRDLNRDGDTDDSILAIMDMNTGQFSITGYATGDEMTATSRGAAFACSEMDQGGRDLNGDRETDDDIVVMVRKKG